MDFCTTCGTRRHGTYTFCGRCGTPFAAAGNAVDSATRPVPVVPARPNPTGAGRVGDHHPGAALSAAQPNRALLPGAQRTGAPLPGAQPSGAHGPGSASAPSAPRQSGQWAAPAAPGAFAARGWTVAAFTRGDWAGAASAVGAGVGAALVLSAAAVLLSGAADVPAISAGGVVALVAMVVALAFGGSVSLSASTGFPFGDSTSTFSGGGGVDGSPLLITAAALTVLSVVFLRRLRSRRAGLVEVVTQAARVWAVLLAALLAIGLVGRMAPDASVTGADGPQVVLSAGIAGTLVGATMWLALVLTFVVAWRLPTVLPARVRVWRDQVAGPFAGAVTAVVVGCVLLLVGGLVAALVDGGTGTASLPDAGVGPVVAAVLLLAPNVLLGAFGFASGVPMTFAADTSASGGLSAGMSRSLLDVTALVPELWLAPLAVVVALLAGGVVTALHAPDVDTARRYGWAMGGPTAVLLGVIAVATSISADGSLLGATVGGTVHLNYVLAPVAGLVWGALAGALGGVLAPALPVSVVQAVRRRVVGAQQRTAGVPVPAPRPAASR